jgi:hypothetical protein
MNTSLSIFAKALASENLSFAFDANAETAAFDVKNRHLIMPVWNVSETVQTMLVAHEISHALWTPYEQSEKLLSEAEAEGFNLPLLQRIANVIEDVRIEKKMKEKFPGTRRDFFLGYKEIADLDLFKFKSMDMTKAGFLNRLNIHYKWGVPGFIPMQFNDAEQEIVDMVDRIETFDQVMELSKYLYKHPSMDEMRKKVEQMAQEGQNSKAVSKMLSEEVQDGDGIGRKDGDEYHATNITILPLDDYKKSIISTDALLNAFEDAAKKNYTPFTLCMDEYRTFVRESDAFVRQLVAQFERRKAADEIRRERPKQTGTLNLDKLHQYRTHDDIFLSKIIKQEGKNHGVCFLLDFSGSMQLTLANAYLQVLQLVWFCEKAKIPFEVFGFTDVHPHHVHPEYEKEYAEWQRKNPTKYSSDFYSTKCATTVRTAPNSMPYGHATLINLASSQDDAAKRERLLAYLYSSIVSETHVCPRPSQIQLGGTPTVESVAIVSQFMQDWVTENNIQIPTVMVVTDGQPNGVYIESGKDNLTGVTYRVLPQHTVTVTNEIMGTVTRMDGTTMQGLDMSNAIIASMLHGLRTKLNARCVGMFVGPRSMTEQVFTSFCMSRREQAEYYAGRNSNTNLTDTPRYEAANDAYNDGCVLLHKDTYPGYDAFFLIKTPKIVKDEDAIAESGTFTKVKNTFIKTMGKKQGSRVFLSRYVDIVAGQPPAKSGEGIYALSALPAGLTPRKKPQF